MTNEERAHALNYVAFLEEVLEKTCAEAKAGNIMTDEEIDRLRAQGRENIEIYKKEKGI